MKRVTFVVALVLVLLVLPWATTSLANADSNPNEFAVGGGFENYATAVPLHFAFSAHCQGGMTSVPCTTASGYVVLHNVQTLTPGTFADISGPVSCLFVSGPFYDIVFTVKNSTTSDFPPGFQGAIFGSGNAPGSSGTVPDTLSFLPAPNCAFPLLGSATPITSGNIVVGDPTLSFIGCPALTDNTTYRINTSCNLYWNTGTSTNPSWTLMQ